MNSWSVGNTQRLAELRSLEDVRVLVVDDERDNLQILTTVFNTPAVALTGNVRVEGPYARLVCWI